MGNATADGAYVTNFDRIVFFAASGKQNNRTHSDKG
jgi:hypothetical protein